MSLFLTFQPVVLLVALSGVNYKDVPLFLAAVAIIKAVIFIVFRSKKGFSALVGALFVCLFVCLFVVSQQS